MSKWRGCVAAAVVSFCCAGVARAGFINGTETFDGTVKDLTGATTALLAALALIVRRRPRRLA